MERPNLKYDGVTHLTYPDELKKTVLLAASAWESFCALSLQTKNIFTSSNTFNGVGYEMKIGTTESKDQKENFDFTAAGASELLTKAIENQDNNNSAVNFINSATQLVDQATPVIKQFGHTIETEFGISGFEDLAVRSAPNAFFRFLHYPSNDLSTGSIIAEPHSDHSGFTLHLLESTDGCERLSFDKKRWEPLPVAKDQAVAFNGMQTQYLANEAYALSHRVIANETTRKFGRFAIVCFVPLKGIPTHNRTKNGRLQDKAPGFNYGMPSQEFAKLFKEI
ncbi:MAG: 2OG-Fe(II) oxygenase family protein [Candidatus Microsaccharimonas sp.]